MDKIVEEATPAREQQESKNRSKSKTRSKKETTSAGPQNNAQVEVKEK